MSRADKRVDGALGELVVVAEMTTTWTQGQIKCTMTTTMRGDRSERMVQVINMNGSTRASANQGPIWQGTLEQFLTFTSSIRDLAIAAADVAQVVDMGDDQ